MTTKNDELKDKTEHRPGVLAIVLIKSAPKKESILESQLLKLIPQEDKTGAIPVECEICSEGPWKTEPGKERPRRECPRIVVQEVAYFFGPFDFGLILTAPDVGCVEQFVVFYLRGLEDVRDTQTMVGIPQSRRHLKKPAIATIKES